MLAFFIPGAPESLLLLGITIALVLPFWMICTKVGLPGWFSLAVFVPVLNILFLYYLAFAEWPVIENERQGLSKQQP